VRARTAGLRVCVRLLRLSILMSRRSIRPSFGAFSLLPHSVMNRHPLTRAPYRTHATSTRTAASPQTPSLPSLTFFTRCDLCLVMLGDGRDARLCAVAILTIGILHWAPEGSRAPAGDWKGPWVSSRCVMDRYWQISRVAGRYVMGWSEEDVVVTCSFGGGAGWHLSAKPSG